MPCEHLRQRSTNSFPFFFILREGKSKGSSFSILLLRSLRSTRCPICPGCLAISAKIQFSQAVQGRNRTIGLSILLVGARNRLQGLWAQRQVAPASRDDDEGVLRLQGGPTGLFTGNVIDILAVSLKIYSVFLIKLHLSRRAYRGELKGL